MLALFLASILALAPCASSLAASQAAGAPQKFEDLRHAFEIAAVGMDAKARQSALDALVASGNPAAMPALSAECTRVTTIVDQLDAKVFRASGLIERKQVQIEQWKLRATRDEEAREPLERESKALEELRSDLAKFQSKLEQERPWQAALVAGTSQLLARLPVEKRKKAEAELLVDASENPNTLVRSAAIDLLGAVGNADSAAALARLAQSLGETCDKYEERLPKLMAEVHKMEARLAKEADKQGDGFSRASIDQYESVKRDAAEVRTRVHETSRESVRAASASAAAIARCNEKQQTEFGPTLLRAYKKSKGRGRRAVLEILSRARVEPVRATLRAQLAAETEPLARANLIDALAAQHDTQSAAVLIEKYLLDPAWLVKAHAAAGLAVLRSREAIPVMIERLELEEGRMRSDLGRALTSLTGQDFRGNVQLWQRWWSDNQASFQVAPEDASKTSLQAAVEAVGVSFFGITTESQRVLFVIDCSLSMNFSMTPKNNPTDEPGRGFDMPDESKGEISRLTAAKRDLEKALGGIRDGGEFNIIGYAADVWAWDDTPALMSPQTRQEALDYVGALEGAAGTNIYSALEKAFDLSGVKAGSTWSKPAFDTIFFLSDGRATIGLSTDTDQILSMVRERNATAGIVLHTIGLSGAQDAELLRRLAEENGGQYVAR